MKKIQFDNDWLRALIAQSGKSNKAIAAEVGITPTTLGNYRSGATVPGDDTLAKIFDALGMTLTEAQAAYSKLKQVVEAVQND